jgi:hypothetical protein
MRRFLLGILSLLIICELLSSFPVAAWSGADRGGRNHISNSLEPCQSQFVEALRTIEREREYAVEKARYRETVARKYAGEKWYDLGLLECALFVPLFGLVLPFFGSMLLGAVRSAWTTPSQESMRKDVH